MLNFNRRNLADRIGYSLALALAVLSQQGCDQKGGRWEAPCASGDLTACASLAQSQSASNPARSVELAQRACDGGEASGCRILAEFVEQGTGVAKDPHKAKELLNKACQGRDLTACEKNCDRGEAKACLTVGALASRGGMDLHRAATYFEKACRAGHPYGCDELAALLNHKQYATIKMSKAQAIARARDLRMHACAGDTKPDFCKL